jgi:putative nucleotidyltransferase with HDIG domain
MRPRSFGRHLYNQIVVPLGVAAVLVGIAATAIAVSYLSANAGSLSDEVVRGATTLIALWSAGAVLALVGLGAWVGSRVSSPLVELADGAGRIAEGDYTAKVAVRGHNEVARLAESFNDMADALLTRDASLTKRVLELAALYEMSRALGSTLDRDLLLDSVLESATRLFGVDLGYVVVRDAETGRLEVSARRGGMPSDVTDDQLHGSLAQWVAREGRPLLHNPSSGGESERTDAIIGAEAALCVPLVSGEGTVGAIAIGSNDPEVRFSSEEVRLLSTIANHVAIAVGNIELFTSLQESYLSTVRSLAAAVDAKDPYTRGHSDRVAGFAAKIATRLDLTNDQCVALEMAAYLHDIGKIGVREEILLKPGPLSEDEMGQMRHHPLIGADILRPVGFPWPIVPVVRHHHERWDGAGYPAGLRGDEIPLLARVLTVADAYEAMTSDRPYRSGRTLSDAIDELRCCSGSHFDPLVVQAFIEALDDSPDPPETVVVLLVEELPADQVREVFVTVCDGILASLRRLGGPKLATNIEVDLNGQFAANELPFSIVEGSLCPHDEGPAVPDVDCMRVALSRIDAAIGRAAGHTIVEHLYTDAAAGLPEDLRGTAVVLGFCKG